MGSHETILCEVQDGIATLTLNRPKSLNAINRQMADEMTQALTHLAADASVRVLLLRGAGDAFCAGGDVRDMADQGPRPAARMKHLNAWPATDGSRWPCTASSAR
jgi:2-(1,2-epoxy-1,2-dihydrophenyl)acetyl-CoA isomerase